MPPEAQAEGKAIVRGLAAKDAARMREYDDEEEKLRLLRAKIKAEDEARAGGAEPPRPKKTLAELEAANAKLKF